MRVVVHDPATWADEVADAWRQRLVENSGLRVCVPSGETPTPVYVRLAGAPMAAAELFLLDEFGDLAPDHPGRSESMVRRDLLAGVAIDPDRFHVPDVDADDLEAECRRYEDLVAGGGGLDLAVLGLGTNGHLGMNEPGSAPDSPTRVVRLTPETRERASRYGIEDPPTWGITIGMRALLAATEVWLLVTGSTKAEALDRALRGPVEAAVPASLLRDHANAVVIADEAALPSGARTA